MKRFVVAVALFWARGALAQGYPVFDLSNFTKAIENLRLMQQQVQQLEATYRQAEATYKATTGSRGLGDVLYNPELRQYLPDDWKTVYDDVAAGRYTGLSGSLKDIARTERLGGTVAQQMDRMRERSRTGAMANKAIGLRAFEGTKARLQQIEALMAQVSRTRDAKAAAEIQARIAIEQAAVANEATKLQLIAMLQAAEERLQAEQRAAAAEKILDPSIRGMPECCSAR